MSILSTICLGVGLVIMPAPSSAQPPSAPLELAAFKRPPAITQKFNQAAGGKVTKPPPTAPQRPPSRPLKPKGPIWRPPGI